MFFAFLFQISFMIFLANYNFIFYNSAHSPIKNNHFTKFLKINKMFINLFKWIYFHDLPINLNLDKSYPLYFNELQNSKNWLLNFFLTIYNTFEITVSLTSSVKDLISLRFLNQFDFLALFFIRFFRFINSYIFRDHLLSSLC